MSWEMVGGLETHIELSTNTKIFCNCSTKFGADPNTNCCPICVGHPGTLPKLNREVVRYAIMAGLVLNCDIRNISKMDRKNYVYPDLSKAYQISQFDKPLCENGYVELSNGRRIGITRIHIEEDAGKLVHQKGDTYVDYNRGGVPLIEIVTEPDIRSVEEIKEYLEKLQVVMKYIGISDCKMQEGSMRCDVNISARPMGSEKFGTRTEIKNMNSFTMISKAVEYEFGRQIDLLESGEEVIQETRRFNDETGMTESMRSKEDAHDYRYFREPDLVTISTTDEEIDELRKLIPELPEVKRTRYIEELGISETDAVLLTKSRKVAEFFEEASQGVKTPKTVSNFILGQIFRRFETEEDKDLGKFPIPAKYLNELVLMLDSGKLKMNLAKETLDKMLDSGKPMGDFISEQDLAGVDDGELDGICANLVEENPKIVSDFLSGKEKAVKALVGQVMKSTKGRADAVKAEQILIEKIKAKA